MIEKKKSLQKVFYILLLFLAILVLFHWYTTENSNRMRERNKNYAADSARLKAHQIDQELNNAQTLIRTYTYFIEKSLTEPAVSAEFLKEMEKNSTFDALRFTDATGITLTSDGLISDTSSRDYYLNGINGETGISIVLSSRITGETMVCFYAPIHYHDEIIGVLRGVYLAEAYMKSMLSTTYFGVDADAFFCMKDGTIVASSNDEVYKGNLFDELTGTGIIDGHTAYQAQEIFENGGEDTLICDPKSKTDNLCVMYLPENEYVLVQTFPKDVTQQMIQAENQVGIYLETALIGLFSFYFIGLLVSSRQQKKLLEHENQEMSYIIDGVNTLFSRFIMIDFETNQYQYLSGATPEYNALAVSGKYKDFLIHLSSSLIEENERQMLVERLQRDSIIAALSENNNDLRFECQMLQDGRPEWEHINIICLERKDGKAVKVLFTRQNITELKENEQRIQAEISLANRRERQYRLAVTSNAVYTFDFNLSRDLIEKDVLYTTGGRQVSLLKEVNLKAPCRASTFFERQRIFVAPESLKEYNAKVTSAHLKEAFEHGKTEVAAEYWMQHRSGEILCIRQSFIMTQDYDTGEIIVLVIAKEITDSVKEQMEHTIALKEALTQAQYASKAKTTFLSNMSHDIRTPLNAILGFTTLALDNIDYTEQVTNCLQNVLTSGRNLLSHINKILDMSKLESEKMQVEEQTCRLSDLAQDLFHTIQPQVQEKHLTALLENHEIFNEEVIADSRKLTQIFLNLLSNAIKYTSPGGTILFRIVQKPSTRSGYGNYVFIVKDTGIGMSSDFIKHIFEPFERETSSTKSGIQGTGLGLTITKYLLDIMNGSIQVESEIGKGSVFTVELVLKLQTTEKSLSPDLVSDSLPMKELSNSNQQSLINFSGKRALLVEDIELNRKIAEAMLKKAGFSVDCAEDGTVAVSMVKDAEEYYYDVILMDVQMPVMDGYEATKIIRSLPRADVKTVPIIAVTANAFEEDKWAALKSGMNAHVAKPLDRNAFFKVLRQFLK